MMNDRLRRNYFSRLASGGKALPARMMDFMLFRGLLYLLFLLIFLTHPLRFLLAGILLFAACALLALFRQLRFRRVEKQELQRIREHLFRDRILQMPASTLRRMLVEEGEQADGLIILRRYEPVAVDDLLMYMDRNDSQIRLLVTSTYPLQTVQRIRHLRPNVVLLDIAWLQTVLKHRMPVTDKMIDGEILRMEKERRLRAKNPPRMPDGSRAAGKYFSLGLLLLALSFVAEHSVYYRLLSSAALLTAGVQASMLLIRRQKRNGPVGLN